MSKPTRVRLPRFGSWAGPALMLVCVCWAAAVSAAAPDYFLFTSFRGNGESGLHLALSTNGFQWKALQGNQPFLRPEVGGKLMRDPCLARGPNGQFHLVWTTGWTAESGRVFGYASSADLLTWSPQRAVEVMQHEPKTRNIWAPELFYDEANDRWLVFWSSTIPGKFTETAATGDNGYNHRIYFVTTKDFQSFSESKLFYDPGFNCIDATLLKANDQFYLFFKDERKNPLKKNLRYATSAKAGGPFGPPSDPFTGNWVEGPSAIQIGNEWLVYFDHYSSPHYYGAARSADLKNWRDCSGAMQFPKGHRHGTVLRISEEIATKLPL